MPRLGGLCRTPHTSAFPGDKERCSMRKAELVQRIAEELGCTQVQAEEAVGQSSPRSKRPSGRASPCILRRFGTWQVRAKRARVGRNPKTGTAAAIAARRVVRFVREPDAEAGGRRGGQPRGLSQHVSALPRHR